MATKKEKVYSDDVAVYDLKQADRFNGNFRKSLSNVEKSGMKISEKQAEAYNKNFENSGSFYKINEKDTEDYLELVEAKTTFKVEEEEVEKTNKD